MSGDGKDVELVFRSAYNEYSVTILWIFTMAFIVILFLPNELKGAEMIPFYLLMISSTILLLWILIDTNYKISDGKLFYYSGPIRGKIPVSAIRKIEKNDTFLKGNTLKPGLGRKGIIIHYNKFDDIYVSPKKRAEFINVLVGINPGIEVVGFEI